MATDAATLLGVASASTVGSFVANTTYAATLLGMFSTTETGRFRARGISNAAQAAALRIAPFAYRGPWVDLKTGVLTREATLFLDNIAKAINEAANR